MKLEGIVFDLDGVLLDTEYYQWQGWVIPLRKFGIELTKEEYFDYAGKTAAIIEEELIKNYDLDVEKGSLFEEKEKLLIEWFQNEELKILPFAVETVEAVKAKGLKVAICSGGPRDEVHLKLERTGLAKYFEVVVSRDDVEKGKPNPDMYLLAVEKIGLRPEECLAFEDTEFGLKAAKSAGLTCLAVPTEYSVKQDFALADGVFSNLKEALDWLEGQMES
jgi:HAD superfamily hydrolase (TIGR01509 family)